MPGQSSLQRIKVGGNEQQPGDRLYTTMKRLLNPRRAATRIRTGAAALQEGWVIANHILVSFHVAFISSVLSLPQSAVAKREVLGFVFASPETMVSAAFMYLSFHMAVALHEMGHFLTAARLDALDERALAHAKARLARPRPLRWLYYLDLAVKIPFGAALGVTREGLNYYPNAPYNLAVAAAGPRASRNTALVTLPPAVALLTVGLQGGPAVATYTGRILLGVGLVAFLDFMLADRGKYSAFRERERLARQQAQSVGETSGWLDMAPQIKRRMLDGRMQRGTHHRLGPVTAPWQFRNCGMGGRHTEKEYPESNVSMQEAMFLILGAASYEEAQELTVRLQTRLKEIIESEEGCRVMGIGLEGGLAPYIDRGPYPLPEVRLWAMMKQAIAECACRPGIDVAIALDPAMSELELAYRAEFNLPDSVGTYLFWRDKAKTVLDRDGVLDLYLSAVERYEIPILSIEDGFSEHDHEGWRLLQQRLGERLFIIGDDLVTTNDRTIERAAGQGLINCVLIKANQIGTLYETLLAMLIALGKGLDLVVSHRSKSPNDDMEAHIALAVNALGLKAGGGANTERLVKYQAVTGLLLKLDEAPGGRGLAEGEQAQIRKTRSYEEPTNAGVPTVGTTVEVSLPSAGVSLMFTGATPLGTSAGSGEAIHLVDATVEYAERKELIDRFPAFFEDVEPGVHAFKRGVEESQIRSEADEDLADLFHRARRYGGKGCLNAVDNVWRIIAPSFEGRDVAALTLLDLDRTLLDLELRTARRRGKLADEADEEAKVHVMQRKQNVGMNAILSVSLALGRAIGRVHGKELYEVLREEMLSVIDRLAVRYGVALQGNTFSDYVRALREVAARVEEDGLALHTVLRAVTGLYEEPGREPQPLAGGPGASAGVRHPARADRAAARSDRPLPAPPVPPEEELVLSGLDETLYAAVGARAEPDIDQAVRVYQATKARLARLDRPFGIVNNRLFRSDGLLTIPYLIEGVVDLHVMRDGAVAERMRHRLPPGSILTDGLMLRLAGTTGAPVDLEGPLYVFSPERTPVYEIARIRDAADLIERVNATSNRNQAVFLLRCLVARLCDLSAKDFLGAKNLQPEIHELTSQLHRFLNGPLRRRLPLLSRLIVRNLSTLVGKPNVIDRLWTDTIDLAERYVPGSDIVNELRRTSHHALGKRTLLIAQAYHAYLATGTTDALIGLGLGFPARADIAARARPDLVEILGRIVDDLQRLLGTSEIVTRIEEWKEAYVETLLRCEFGRSVEAELATVLSEGVQGRNRWVYYHHLRILAGKVGSFGWPEGLGADLVPRIEAALASRPDADDFDAAAATRGLNEGVAAVIRRLREAYERPVFTALEDVIAAYRSERFAEAFRRTAAVRLTLAELIERGGFEEQRYQLCQLDTLLEEMGYLALGHVATGYQERSVDVDEALEIIRLSALNLRHDGLESRELGDFVAILGDRGKTDAELLDVLESIERIHHRVRQRVTVPYERLKDRLALESNDLRLILANMQRYLHDLNNMVQFADLAATVIRARIARGSAPPSVVAEPGPAQAADLVLHLSHRQEITRWVESPPAAGSLRERYGGKGSGLLYISYLNLPTRDGFVFPTAFARAGLHRRDPAHLRDEVARHLDILERDIAARDGVTKRFGNPGNPLVLAVRGGSVLSMPGILTTVVFVGMNDEIAESLAEDGPWRAYDSYRRSLASYAMAAWRVDLEDYGLVEKAKQRHGVRYKQELPWEAMRDVAEQSKVVLRELGFGAQLQEILDNPFAQLVGAVDAVMGSWSRDRARRFRAIKGMSERWQTAVIVQEMAFGNRANDAVEPGMDETRASLTGVITRTHVTDAGTRAFEGELKFSAAGDDLVGGVTFSGSVRPIQELETLMPMLGRRLRHAAAKIRRFLGTDQEVEFTVDRGVLSILQTRRAETSFDRSTERFLNPGDPATRGLGVRGGGFRGLAAFDEADLEELRAVDLSERDDVDGVLLVIENPTPDDIPLIISADGLLTARGGSTSHAAVAINAIENKKYSGVMSAANLRVHTDRHEATIVDSPRGPGCRIRKGDIVSIHGTTGEVYLGSRRRQVVAE
jgi:enolase